MQSWQMQSWQTLDPRLAPYADAGNLDRATLVQRPRRLSAPVHPDRAPGLSVIILTLNRPELIVPLVRDLTALAPGFAAAGLGYEVLVGDTGSTDAAVLAFYEGLAADGPVRVVRGLRYQFSARNNDLFYAHARFDAALFLNNDVVIAEAPGALAAMREALFSAPDVGITGLVMHFGDGVSVQHAGIDFFRGGPLDGLCYHPGARAQRPADSFPAVAEVPAVTGACLMIRADLFLRAGGFEEDYGAECQDVDLCLKVRRLGARTLLVRHGTVLHLENATRPKGDEHWADRRLYMRRWNAFTAAVFPEPAA